MEFHCVACNYKAQKRANYIRHLETEKHKRNVCEISNDGSLNLRDFVMVMKTQMESYEEKTKALEEKTKLFEEQTKAIQEENLSLKQRVRVLETSLMNSKKEYNNCDVQNNQFNGSYTNINIEVKPFGDESWKHLTNESVLEIMKDEIMRKVNNNNCVPKLIKKQTHKTV